MLFRHLVKRSATVVGCPRVEWEAVRYLKSWLTVRKDTYGIMPARKCWGLKCFFNGYYFSQKDTSMVGESE